MLKNLFKKKPSIELINTHEADVVLRLMFEIAISDGKLDSAELKMIRRRANKIASEDVKASTIIKKIIDESTESVSFYPSVKKINETHSIEEKKDSYLTDKYINAVPIKFAYAITCHKAQGGEWDNVSIHLPMYNSEDEEYFRWLYTAITRSAKVLSFINLPE